MKLTPLQVASLKQLQRYRETPPTVRGRLLLAARSLILLVPLVLLLGYLSLVLRLAGVFLFVVGLCLGAIAREIGHQLRYVRFWSLNREITRWDHVDELVGGSRELPGADPVPKRAVRAGYAVAIGVTLFTLAFGGAVSMERTLAYVYNPTRNNPANHVIVLSASWCPYCMSLRHHLTGLKVPYADLDTENTTEGRRAYAAIHGNGIPITIVGEQIIRGLGPATSPWAKVDDALTRAGYVLPSVKEAGD